MRKRKPPLTLNKRLRGNRVNKKKRFYQVEEKRKSRNLSEGEYFSTVPKDKKKESPSITRTRKGRRKGGQQVNLHKEINFIEVADSLLRNHWWEEKLHWQAREEGSVKKRCKRDSRKSV